MNDYCEYEQFEQVRVYFEAAWITALQTTNCVECARKWFLEEHNRVLEKSISTYATTHEP